ncbi:MAG: type IV pilin protein, partial [Christensenellaceae bacterium]
MKKNLKKGFTIIELVIVIAVIGILMAVLIPTFTGVVAKANKSAAMQEARNFYTLLDANTITGTEYKGTSTKTYTIQMTSGGLVVTKSGEGSNVGVETILKAVLAEDYATFKDAKIGYVLSAGTFAQGSTWTITKAYLQPKGGEYAAEIDLVAGTVTEAKKTTEWTSVPFFTLDGNEEAYPSSSK